jgi:hypothetical protein
MQREGWEGDVNAGGFTSLVKRHASRIEVLEKYGRVRVGCRLCCPKDFDCLVAKVKTREILSWKEPRAALYSFLLL